MRNSGPLDALLPKTRQGILAATDINNRPTCRVSCRMAPPITRESWAAPITYSAISMTVFEFLAAAARTRVITTNLFLRLRLAYPLISQSDACLLDALHFGH
jgi:hypothetical protein